MRKQKWHCMWNLFEQALCCMTTVQTTQTLQLSINRKSLLFLISHLFLCFYLLLKREKKNRTDKWRTIKIKNYKTASLEKSFCVEKKKKKCEKNVMMNLIENRQTHTHTREHCKQKDFVTKNKNYLLIYCDVYFCFFFFYLDFFLQLLFFQQYIMN